MSALFLGIIVGENYRIHVKFLSVTGDSPALRNVLNFTSHTGFHPCNFCLIRGTYVDKKLQFYYEENVITRDSTKYDRYSAIAQEGNFKLYGHKGDLLFRRFHRTLKT